MSPDLCELDTTEHTAFRVAAAIEQRLPWPATTRAWHTACDASSVSGARPAADAQGAGRRGES